MDANFSRDLSRRRFAEWTDKRYNPGIRALVRAWVNDMEKNGKVRVLVSLIDPMEHLCTRESLLRRGLGHANYAIMTDGHIAPCPIMIGMKQDLSRPHRGRRSKEPAPDRCGGRVFSVPHPHVLRGPVPVFNIVQPWNPAAGSAAVRGKPARRSHGRTSPVPGPIASGRIHLPDFAHEKFNGCEIIP